MLPREDWADVQLQDEIARHDRELLEDLEREAQARAHFPHLSPSVAPRESDETPTYWEDA